MQFNIAVNVALLALCACAARAFCPQVDSVTFDRKLTEGRWFEASRSHPLKLAKNIASCNIVDISFYWNDGGQLSPQTLQALGSFLISARTLAAVLQVFCMACKTFLENF